MYAKYIKQEYTDLNGTGRTQAFYKMELTGLARTAATVELRKIVLDPSSGITFRGEKSQKMYVLRVTATGR